MLVKYGIGPFLDTLWYTVVLKSITPIFRSSFSVMLSHLETILDFFLMFRLNNKSIIRTPFQALYEIILVMNNDAPLRILSFFAVRFMFDTYLSLGYGFSPEHGIVLRHFLPEKSKKPSFSESLLLFAASCSGILFFHVFVPSDKAGALGVYGALNTSSNHILGLSILAELIASVFFYAGVNVAINCKQSIKNVILVKLILNMTGVFITRAFTYDFLNTGVLRDPLRCFGAALSSAIENQSIGIFATNGIIHLMGIRITQLLFCHNTMGSEDIAFRTKSVKYN